MFTLEGCPTGTGIVFRIALRVVTVITCLFASANSLIAQWTALAPLQAGMINGFASSGSRLYVASGHGVLTSSDDGVIWRTLGNDITSSTVNSVAVSGNTIFATTTIAGVFRSTNAGATWSAMNSGLNDLHIMAVYVSGADVYLATQNGDVYRSTLSGSGWARVSSRQGPLMSFASSGGVLYAGQWGLGVVRSTDRGVSWSYATTPMTVTPTSLAVAGSLVIAATNRGIYLSSDGGLTWTPRNHGVDTTDGEVAVTVIGSTLVAANRSYVYRSMDSGITWHVCDSTHQGFSTLYSTPSGHLLSAIPPGMVRVSTDAGNSWRSASNAAILADVHALHIAGEHLLAACDDGTLFSFGSSGSSWSSLHVGHVSLWSLETMGNLLFVGSTEGITRYSMDVNGIDAGDSLFSPLGQILGVQTMGPEIFAAGHNGVYRSSDSGRTWDTINSGLNLYYYITRLFSDGTRLIACTDGSGLFVWNSSQSSWERLDGQGSYLDGSVYSLAQVGSALYAGTSGGAFRSTDGGIHWTDKSTDFTRSTTFDVLAVGNGIFAGNNYVTCSTDNGTTWPIVSTGLQMLFFRTLAASGPYLFAGGEANNGSADGNLFRRNLSDMVSLSSVKSEAIDQTSFVCYPDPADRVVHLELPTYVHGDVTATFYNALGLKVGTVCATDVDLNSQTDMDCSRLPDRAYLVDCQADGVQLHSRIMICHE